MKNRLSHLLQNFNLEHLTTIMGVCGHFAAYIQAYHIFYLKSAYAVSLLANCIAFSSIICWLAYGIKEKIRPLIISNIFGLIGVFTVMVGILYHR